VSVASVESSKLTVTSFTIMETGQAGPLDARLLTQDSDPNRYLASNTAYLVSKVPFKRNTSYTVSYLGTVNGAPHVKDVDFHYADLGRIVLGSVKRMLGKPTCVTSLRFLAP
jgi:hypothetical protein